ncbi:MAG: FtsX-like permease family protein [Cyclobacteriaceae bacterium]
MSSVNGTSGFEIVGVFQNKQPSHIDADVLISLVTLERAWDANFATGWGSFDFVTYVRLAASADPVAFEAALPAFADRHGGESRGSSRVVLTLQPLADIHLHSHYNQEISVNEDFDAILFLAVIGVMVLFIAWVNYVNLYTALVSERTKEVGVRKSLGSSRLQLIWQYLTEAGIINMLSIILALVLVYTVVQQGESWGVVFLLPEFSWHYIVVPIIFFATSTLISGLYPAILLSRAGLKKTDETSRYRNWLVVGQFAVSAALITGTFLVVSQFYYMQNASTGIDTSSVIAVPLTDFRDDREGHVRSLQRVKREMASISGVVSTAYGSDIPGTEVGWRGGSVVIGTNDDEIQSHLLYRMTLDESLLSLLKVDIVAGRGFLGLQDSLAVLINERAVLEYGFGDNEEAINKKIRFSALDTLRVVGVVEDYFQEALSEPIKPTAYFFVPNEIRYLFVKYDQSNEMEILAKLESLVNIHFPKNNFDPQLIDDNMGDRHASTEQFLFLFNAFAGLAILISVLGLIGLASYNAQRHQKEMSIRKVLGASTASLNVRFLIAFIKLTLLGNLIAIPLIYVLGRDWLEGFVYRIDFDWSYPVYTMLVCSVITIGSTVYATYRAANANPVKILRAE